MFALGQGLGCLIYVRNLVLIRRRSVEYRSRQADQSTRNGRGPDLDPLDP